nr:bifunctional adenosylcobinamide kinase/adenosylcobinamide-phosphate guanylyltransferase [Ramlibacter aurantiacus]
MRVARSELILGAGPGARSARAQALAASWLAEAPQHRAVCIDTAQAWDPELRALVERCRRDTSAAGRSLPRLEQPSELAQALGSHSRPDTLIVVDCLSFWLTATLVHAMGADDAEGAQLVARGRPLRLADAVNACAGPLVLVGNRIGAAGAGQPDLRRLLETLGSLEQQAVQACERVTLMSAGLPLTLKDR